MESNYHKPVTLLSATILFAVLVLVGAQVGATAATYDPPPVEEHIWLKPPLILGDDVTRTLTQ